MTKILGISCWRGRASSVSDWPLETLHQLASDINKSKRQSYPGVCIAGSAETVWQVTNCREIFDVGSLRLTHGNITTPPSNRGRVALGHGSLTATRSRNGKQPDRALSYGFTGNVSCPPALTRWQRLMNFPFRSGLWEECTLVR